MGEQQHDVTLQVNGIARPIQVPARRLLSDALRHDLRLTGTHVGCEHGVCGCCTVLIDGQPARSCLMFAVTAADYEITTVEGLSPDDGSLHPIQRAFQECHGLQCGFCTPGFVMTVSGLLTETPDPTDDEILEGISGNLCRCTGYRNILASVHRAAVLLADDAATLPPVDAGTATPAPPTLDQATAGPYAPAGHATPAAGDGAAADVSDDSDRDDRDGGQGP